MKKVMIICGAALLALASCKKDVPAPPAPTPPPVENPAPPHAPKPQVETKTTVKTTTPVNDDGTSVNINGNGISVKNKKGDKENNVSVSGKSTEVNIKTN